MCSDQALPPASATAGPWYVDGPFVVRSADGQRVADLWPAPVVPGMRAANGRLIAAAPDLLAALRDMVDLFDRESGINPIRDYGLAALSRARALLAAQPSTDNSGDRHG